MDAREASLSLLSRFERRRFLHEGRASRKRVASVAEPLFVSSFASLRACDVSMPSTTSATKEERSSCTSSFSSSSLRAKERCHRKRRRFHGHDRVALHSITHPHSISRSRDGARERRASVARAPSRFERGFKKRERGALAREPCRRREHRKRMRKRTRKDALRSGRRGIARKRSAAHMPSCAGNPRRAKRGSSSRCFLVERRP